MANKAMITVAILARNEAENLRELLPELSWADRLIVVDDDSEDGTEAVAREFGAVVIKRSLQGNYADQRNAVLAHVGTGWVLFLDADERLEPGANQEIRQAIETADEIDGFAFQRVDVFYGKPLRYGETGNAWYVRLGRLGRGKWRGQVHEVWNINKTANLPVKIYHHSHTSINQLFRVVRAYAQLRAKELYGQGQYWNAWEQLVFPLGKFLYTYIYKLGFLEGWRGLVMSAALSYHSFLVRLHLGQLAGKPAVFLLVLPFLLLPLGQLERWQIGQGAAVYAHEIVMGMSLVWGAFTFNRKGWFKNYLSWWVFSGVLAASSMYGLVRGMPPAGALYLVRWLLYAGFFMVCDQALRQELIKVSVKGLLTYAGLGLLLLGWVQYLLIPDMRFLFYWGFDDHYYRMVGTLFDPNFLGLILVLAALLTGLSSKRRLEKVWLMPLALGLAATYSRLSWVVGGIAGIFAVPLNKKSLPLVGVAIIVVAGVFLWLPKPGGEGVNLLRTYSIETRINTMREGWNYFTQNPVLGIGFNRYKYLQSGSSQFGQPYHPSAPDNSFLYILATGGLAGFAAYVWLLAGWWQKYPKLWQRLSLVVILLHSLGNNSFFYPFVLMWWLGVMLCSQEGD